MSHELRVGIFGATGYTGYELVGILMRHPQAGIEFATSESYAGQRLSDIFPCPWDIELIGSAQAPLDAIDVAFLCLPHGTSMGMVKWVYEAGVRVVDLSADFRLNDAKEYERWYKTEHIVPELLPEAVYGLTELYRAEIREARLVANPGCYPTAVLLGLYPLVKRGLLKDEKIVIDAKSGISGAGRQLSLPTHFVEANENLSPYSIGHVHRHISEMEQELNRLRIANCELRTADFVVSAQSNDCRWQVIFSPHLVPLNRGILSTIYVTLREALSEAELVDVYGEAYAGEPFIHLLPPGRLATLRHVVGTNRCAISLTKVSKEGYVIVVSAIDNLIKGASGQAVQNMNVMFGLEETLGLT